MKRKLGSHLRVVVCASAVLVLFSCRSSDSQTIAVIPQTTGLSLWEAEHAGAEAAALKTAYRLYWNAPTREDDVERQIQIVDRAVRAGDVGLILAPDQSLALITPVRRAVSNGIHTVIVGSALSIPPGKDLAYILNDDEQTGRIVARRIGEISGGKGSVAIIGINPDVTATLVQVRAFEESLQQSLTGIQIIERRMRSYDPADAVQIAAEILKAHPDLDAIWALSAVEAGGAFVALQASHRANQVKLIGCQQDLDIIAHVRAGQMDSVVIENTFEMGYRAVMLIAQEAKGQPVALETKLEPTLVTRENVDSPEVQRQLSQKWNYRH